jgi:dethiobiotin synthetase
MNYFVTAIHTDSGKTLVSAILCEALQADYWKPVQAGYPTDSETLRGLIQHSQIVVHPERYILKSPMSPHAAAKIDGIKIDINDFQLPPTTKDLIIEGAGGCLVPLNDNHFVVDIASMFSCEVILVSNLYLGSINHTLLTFEALTKRNLSMAGIIFNGTPNEESESIILHHTKLPCLLRIQPEKEITPATVTQYANKLNETWHRRIKH